MSSADVVNLIRQKEGLLRKLADFEVTNKALRKLLKDQSQYEVAVCNFVLKKSLAEAILNSPTVRVFSRAFRKSSKIPLAWTSNPARENHLVIIFYTTEKQQFSGILKLLKSHARR